MQTCTRLHADRVPTVPGSREAAAVTRSGTLELREELVVTKAELHSTAEKLKLSEELNKRALQQAQDLQGSLLLAKQLAESLLAEQQQLVRLYGENFLPEIKNQRRREEHHKTKSKEVWEQKVARLQSQLEEVRASKKGELITYKLRVEKLEEKFGPRWDVEAANLLKNAERARDLLQADVDQAAKAHGAKLKEIRQAKAAAPNPLAATVSRLKAKLAKLEAAAEVEHAHLARTVAASDQARARVQKINADLVDERAALRNQVVELQEQLEELQLQYAEELRGLHDHLQDGNWEPDASQDGSSAVKLVCMKDGRSFKVCSVLSTS
jgi:hypothetical protein